MHQRTCIFILFFIAFCGLKSNAQSISILKDINPSLASSSPNGLKNLNGQLVFVAYTPTYGYELWISDGTETGTHLLKDIYPGNSSSSPTHLYIHNEKLFFLAEDPTHGKEFWVSDGTSSGTVLLKDIYAGPSSNIDPEFMSYLSVGDTLYFVANDSIHGVELWRTEGTAATTSMVADIAVGPEASWPFDLIYFNNNLFFSASTPATGYELWRSNGTAAGTEIIADIYPNMQGSVPQGFTILNNRLYFAASTENNTGNLWETDGTQAGTQLVTPDLNFISRLLTWNNQLYFVASNIDHGRELWSSDGTAGGTFLVKDINSGGLSAFTLNAANKPNVHNNKLYFSASDSLHGYELWSSDGTESGTDLVYEFNPGTSNGFNFSFEMFDYNGFVYLSAQNSDENVEPWLTDGTASGTHPVIDVFPGVFGSYPDQYTQVGNTLFFTADHPDYGIEVFYFNDDLSSASVENDLAIAFPNPFQNVLSVSLQNFTSCQLIRLIQPDGRVVLEMPAEKESSSFYFATEKLNPGMYLIQLRENDRVLKTIPVIRN